VLRLPVGPVVIGAVALALALALAAGPFGVVTVDQYHHVHLGQTRHHVEHRVFDGVTGVPLAHWRGHTIREYRSTQGRVIDISYRRPAPDRPWRVYRKQRYVSD
jgi:hypothetical protein